MNKPCEQCPWRLTNQGKRSPGGFYTKANLQRLWNQIRRGGLPQSCHLTDPSHPDHVAAGASRGAKPQECPGSVVVVLRELKLLADGADCVEGRHIDHYLKTRSRGLTRSGLRYWLLGRASQLADTIVGERALPPVDDADPEIGLPTHLQ